MFKSVLCRIKNKLRNFFIMTNKKQPNETQDIEMTVFSYTDINIENTIDINEKQPTFFNEEHQTINNNDKLITFFTKYNKNTPIKLLTETKNNNKLITFITEDNKNIIFRIFLWAMSSKVSFQKHGINYDHSILKGKFFNNTIFDSG